MRHARTLVLSLMAALALTGCASFKVTQVTDLNAGTVKGQRYYLPKPVLQVTPNADGTISVNVIYLPDTKHEYAIAASSTMSAYTVQILPDQAGLLATVEYKRDATGVAQQLASSVGQLATQAGNYRLAQLPASQTAINTAQGTVDTNRAAMLAAQAALDADTKTNADAVAAGGTGPITPAALATDANTLAQAQAKLQASQDALKRTQDQTLAVSQTLTAAAPGPAGTTPAVDTTLTATSWMAPNVYNLPDRYGGVLFAINDEFVTQKDNSVEEEVSLVPVKSTITTDKKPYDEQDGVDTAAQPTFNVSFAASAPPTLGPTNPTFKISDKTGSFTFTRTVRAVVGATVTPKVAGTGGGTATVKLNGDNKTLVIDVSQLKAAVYTVSMQVGFLTSIDGTTPTTKVTTVSADFTVQ